MMINSISQYKKACRVIDSCTNLLHLDAARTYTNLFFKLNSKRSYKTKYGFTEYITDSMIGDMYERLKEKLFKKEFELKN